MPKHGTVRTTANELAGSSGRPRNNGLLDSLPPEDYNRVASHLVGVTLDSGQLLNEQAARLEYVYFPVSAVLSLQCLLEDGSTTEIAGIGHESLFGASVLMGDAIESSQALVQNAGLAYRAPVEPVAREFQRGGAFQQIVLRHVQALFMQMAQTSACNRSHTVEQRLCRWLLGIFERGVNNELIATQDRLGCILGVRRESVTATAGRLQAEGAIRYRRGRIEILDAPALEQRSCACHSVLKHLYERHSHSPRPSKSVGNAGYRPIRPPATRSGAYARGPDWAPIATL